MVSLPQSLPSVRIIESEAANEAKHSNSDEG